MKKLFTFILSFFLIVFLVHSQQCDVYFPLNTGAKLTYKHYDNKGKQTGSSAQTVKNIQKSGDNLTIEVLAESYDKKGKMVYSYPFTVACKDGTFYVDMKQYMNQESMAGFQDMEVKFEGSNLEMPSNLKAGQSLSDGHMKMTVSTAGITIMTMSINVTERRVEGNEKITTSTGSFNCTKISQNVNMQAIINVTARNTEWYAKNVGMIKSESYNSDGKLTSTTELVSIE